MRRGSGRRAGSQRKPQPHGRRSPRTRARFFHPPPMRCSVWREDRNEVVADLDVQAVLLLKFVEPDLGDVGPNAEDIAEVRDMNAIGHYGLRSAQ